MTLYNKVKIIMKHITEYRDKALIKGIIDSIDKVASRMGKVTIMEVCGTHTMAIFRFGVKDVIPKNVRLISGPGCPVCVSPIEFIDKGCSLANTEDVIIATFGDMIRVPGSWSSLRKQAALGADVRIITSPLEALELAALNPLKKIVLLSIGFETTTPMIAYTIVEAQKKGINNFFILCANKLVPPALSALVSDSELSVDGFLCPGHVSVVIGAQAYKELVCAAKRACVICGFEPLDILSSIYNLLIQIKDNNPLVVNEYSRVVTEQGNIEARAVINKVFDVCDSDWRGIGIIPKSGLCLKKEFKNFDAETNIDFEFISEKRETQCICGSVLKGVAEPPDCALFGSKCTPEEPIGACMVSSEGTCAAWYKYKSSN